MRGEVQQRRPLYIIGFMGAGKTTDRAKIIRTSSYTCFDTDLWIEQAEGKTISEIFAEKGEAYFRE